MYHAQSNHFSHWLMARTEFALAAKLRPRKVSDFNGPEHLRTDLIASINDYRREQNEVLIGDFKADTPSSRLNRASSESAPVRSVARPAAWRSFAISCARAASRVAFPECGFQFPPLWS